MTFDSLEDDHESARRAGERARRSKDAENQPNKGEKQAKNTSKVKIKRKNR